MAGQCILGLLLSMALLHCASGQGGFARLGRTSIGEDVSPIRDVQQSDILSFSTVDVGTHNITTIYGFHITLYSEGSPQAALPSVAFLVDPSGQTVIYADTVRIFGRVTSRQGMNISARVVGCSLPTVDCVIITSGEDGADGEVAGTDGAGGDDQNHDGSAGVGGAAGHAGSNAGDLRIACFHWLNQTAVLSLEAVGGNGGAGRDGGRGGVGFVGRDGQRAEATNLDPCNRGLFYDDRGSYLRKGCPGQAGGNGGPGGAGGNGGAGGSGGCVRVVARVAAPSVGIKVNAGLTGAEGRGGAGGAEGSGGFDGCGLAIGVGYTDFYDVCYNLQQASSGVSGAAGASGQTDGAGHVGSASAPDYCQQLAYEPYTYTAAELASTAQWKADGLYTIWPSPTPGTVLHSCAAIPRSHNLPWEFPWNDPGWCGCKDLPECIGLGPEGFGRDEWKRHAPCFALYCEVVTQVHARSTCPGKTRDGWDVLAVGPNYTQPYPASLPPVNDSVYAAYWSGYPGCPVGTACCAATCALTDLEYDVVIANVTAPYVKVEQLQRAMKGAEVAYLSASAAQLSLATKIYVWIVNLATCTGPACSDDPDALLVIAKVATQLLQQMKLGQNYYGWPAYWVPTASLKAIDNNLCQTLLPALQLLEGNYNRYFVLAASQSQKADNAETAIANFDSTIQHYAAAVADLVTSTKAVERERDGLEASRVQAFQSLQNNAAIFSEAIIKKEVADQSLSFFDVLGIIGSALSVATNVVAGIQAAQFGAIGFTPSTAGKAILEDPKKSGTMPGLRGVNLVKTESALIPGIKPAWEGLKKLFSSPDVNLPPAANGILAIGSPSWDEFIKPYLNLDIAAGYKQALSAYIDISQSYNSLGLQLSTNTLQIWTLSNTTANLQQQISGVSSMLSNNQDPSAAPIAGVMGAMYRSLQVETLKNLWYEYQAFKYASLTDVPMDTTALSLGTLPTYAGLIAMRANIQNSQLNAILASQSALVPKTVAVLLNQDTAPLVMAQFRNSSANGYKVVFTLSTDLAVYSNTAHVLINKVTVSLTGLKSLSCPSSVGQVNDHTAYLRLTHTGASAFTDEQGATHNYQSQQRSANFRFDFLTKSTEDATFDTPANQAAGRRLSRALLHTGSCSIQVADPNSNIYVWVSPFATWQLDWALEHSCVDFTGVTGITLTFQGASQTLDV